MALRRKVIDGLFLHWEFCYKFNKVLLAEEAEIDRCPFYKFPSGHLGQRVKRSPENARHRIVLFSADIRMCFFWQHLFFAPLELVQLASSQNHSTSCKLYSLYQHCTPLWRFCLFNCYVNVQLSKFMSTVRVHLLPSTDTHTHTRMQPHLHVFLNTSFCAFLPPYWLSSQGPWFLRLTALSACTHTHTPHWQSATHTLKHTLLLFTLQSLSGSFICIQYNTHIHSTNTLKKYKKFSFTVNASSHFHTHFNIYTFAHTFKYPFIHWWLVLIPQNGINRLALKGRWTWPLKRRITFNGLLKQREIADWINATGLKPEFIAPARI